MAKKQSARSIKSYTKHLLRPQLELDLSGDRAQALRDEAQAQRRKAAAASKSDKSESV